MNSTLIEGLALDRSLFEYPYRGAYVIYMAKICQGIRVHRKHTIEVIEVVKEFVSAGSYEGIPLEITPMVLKECSGGLRTVRFSWRMRSRRGYEREDSEDALFAAVLASRKLRR